MAHWVDKGISAAYAAFRPTYPSALYNYVASVSRHSDSCLDVGCGTGQALQGLAPHFGRLHGIDTSATQLEVAHRAPHIDYSVGSASNFGFQDRKPPPQFDLITVAQAMHWFDIAAFERQVDNYLAPHGVLCVWLYPTCCIASHPGADRLLQDFDAKLIQEGHWPPERLHIDNRYVNLLPLFKKFSVVDRRSFFDEKVVTIDTFGNYLSTWSGLDRLVKTIKADKKDFVSHLKQRFVATIPNATLDTHVGLRFEHVVFTFRRTQGQAKL
jgi:SAM-dependent methyltransferase